MIIKLAEIIQQAQKMCGIHPPIPLSTIIADITNQSLLFLFEFGYSSRIFSSKAPKATTTNWSNLAGKMKVICQPLV